MALGTVVPDISLITFFCGIVNKRRPTKLVTSYLKAESAVFPIRELKSINENITESRSGTDLGIVIGQECFQDLINLIRVNLSKLVTDSALVAPKQGLVFNIETAPVRAPA